MSFCDELNKITENTKDCIKINAIACFQNLVMEKLQSSANKGLRKSTIDIVSTSLQNWYFQLSNIISNVNDFLIESIKSNALFKGVCLHYCNENHIHLSWEPDDSITKELEIIRVKSIIEIQNRAISELIYDLKHIMIVVAKRGMTNGYLTISETDSVLLLKKIFEVETIKEVYQRLLNDKTVQDNFTGVHIYIDEIKKEFSNKKCDAICFNWELT